MDSVIYLESVDSTNRYASDHFDELADGTLVYAGTQTAGRGRLGRRWDSPSGNVYASYVMKDVTGDAFFATMASSLAVTAAIRETAPEADVWIKWPNDVFIRDCKICGILCEGVIRGGALKGVICGIGVNVNMTEQQLQQVGQRATSLFFETKREIVLKKFIKSLAIYLKWYYIIGISSRAGLFDQWKKQNRLIGQCADFKGADGSVFSADVLGISDDGLLQIRRKGHTDEELFSCGDVKVVL